LHHDSPSRDDPRDDEPALGETASCHAGDARPKHLLLAIFIPALTFRVVLPCSEHLNMSATLYYNKFSSGSISYVAAHIAGLIQSGKVKAFEIDFTSHLVLEGPCAGKDFFGINPKGNVPALVIDDGTLLNEGAAIVQWIADQAPESGLAPANGTAARYVLQAHLNYLASEVQPAISALFQGLKGEARDAQVAKLMKKLSYLSGTVLEGGKRHYLGGAGEGSFSVADVYLCLILTWFQYVKVDLAKENAVLQAYMERVNALKPMQEAQAVMHAAGTGKH
jgi:glutathione S-transferase